MIKLFARLFIKNHKEYTVPEVREQYGVLCSAFGIFLNVLLFVAKLTGAAITHSVAVLADALNNLSDAASSVVSVIGFKLSGKKPDADHPFGHGRLEYISGLIVSFLILLMGIELFKSSIGAIRSPAKTEGGIFSIAILSASILVKLYMYVYN
ncbi:MAG: cation diffusion facilitator family transporter, partial [Treponema sp.]|nr:cation diffusion facilitator family transporter [Treponema sp.]